MIKIKRACTSN